MLKYFKFFAVIGFIFLFFSHNAFAVAIDDGFGAAGKIEGRYFTIYSAIGIDLPALSQQLNVTVADGILAGRPAKEEAFAKVNLADMLDTLFTQICDILDMRLYSFKGNIKICKDQQQLREVYNNLYAGVSGQASLGAPAFYTSMLNTIYVTARDFKKEVVSHEIAHAVMANYFVVGAPEKVQEILSGYVEYRLRKE